MRKQLLRYRGGGDITARRIRDVGQQQTTVARDLRYVMVSTMRELGHSPNSGRPQTRVISVTVKVIKSFRTRKNGGTARCCMMRNPAVI